MRKKKTNEKYNIMLEEVYHAGSGRCEDILQKHGVIYRSIFGVPYSILDIGEEERIKPDSDDLYEVGALDIIFTRVKVGVYNDDLKEEFVIPMKGAYLDTLLLSIEAAYNEWMERKRQMLGSNWSAAEDDPFYQY